MYFFGCSGVCTHILIKIFMYMLQTRVCHKQITITANTGARSYRRLSQKNREDALQLLLFNLAKFSDILSRFLLCSSIKRRSPWERGTLYLCFLLYNILCRAGAQSPWQFLQLLMLYTKTAGSPLCAIFATTWEPIPRPTDRHINNSIFLLM